MPINPYLVFEGSCREAVQFYAHVFGCKMEHIMTFGDVPGHPLPESAKHLIMHTFLMIEGSIVMFSDHFPGSPYTIGNNINLTCVMDDRDKLRTIFNQLSKDGKIIMELQETSWSKCYGMIVDQFGINWQLNLRKD